MPKICCVDCLNWSSILSFGWQWNMTATVLAKCGTRTVPCGSVTPPPNLYQIRDHSNIGTQPIEVETQALQEAVKLKLWPPKWLPYHTWIAHHLHLLFAHHFPCLFYFESISNISQLLFFCNFLPLLSHRKSGFLGGVIVIFRPTKWASDNVMVVSTNFEYPHATNISWSHLFTILHRKLSKILPWEILIN